MDTLSTRGKLLVGFGSVLGVFILVCMFTFYQFRNNAEAAKWTTHTYEVIDLTGKLLGSLLNIETGQRGFLLAGQDNFLAPLKQGESDFESALAQIKAKTSDNPKQQERLQSLEKIYTRWKSDVVDAEVSKKRSLDMSLPSLEAVVAMARSEKGKAGMDQMRAIIATISDEERSLLGARAETASASARSTTTTLILGVIISTLFGGGFAMVFSGRLIRQLGAEPAVVTQFAQAISRGELSDSRQQIVCSSDSIMGAMIHMSGQLRAIITGLRSAVDNLKDTSRQLSTSSERSIRELRLQKEETEQVATAMNEMTATVNEVARNTQYASEATTSVNNRVEEGGKLVACSVKSVLDLHREIEAAASVISQLSQESKEIGTVLDVIRSIAEQTNLLALNAAIEAARAGEQGRGFAVVADEVRTLASRTHLSTEEIRSMIERLQAGVANAVATMEKSRNEAQDTVDFTKQTEVILGTIRNSASDVNGMNLQIATAAEEQTKVAEEINHNIIKINEIANITVTAILQVERSSKDIMFVSDDLQEKIAFFKL